MITGFHFSDLRTFLNTESWFFSWYFSEVKKNL